jgi:DNA-binding CsgD family transcriptional regulator
MHGSIMHGVKATRFERAADFEGVAAIIGKIGTPGLPLSLDVFLHDVAPFDLSVIFGYPFGRAPILLHDGYRGQATRAAMDEYMRGGYLLDPFYTASVEGHTPGLWRMRQLSPDKFFESEFYSAAEVHPCVSMQPGSLVEEIGFLVPLPAGFYAAYSLMRSLGRPPFSEGELEDLRSVAGIVTETLRTHWRGLETEDASTPFDGSMESTFATFCEDRLTQQQRRIVQLVLRGHSSHAIASLIGVAEGTVKNHRKAIYRRLNISSQSELFAMFVRHINRA